jgi:hypothetical protein
MYSSPYLDVAVVCPTQHVPMMQWALRLDLASIFLSVIFHP